LQPGRRAHFVTRGGSISVRRNGPMAVLLLWGVLALSPPAPLRAQQQPTDGVSPGQVLPEVDGAQPIGPDAGAGEEPPIEDFTGAARPEADAPGTTAAPAAPAEQLRPVAEAVTLEPGATCLEAERLTRRIARWLERDQIEQSIRVHVRGDERDSQAVRFSIEAAGGRRAERNLLDAPEDCAQMHAAVALSVAMAIDATLTDAAAEAVELPEDEELVEPTEPPEPPYHRGAIALLGQLGSGVLPGLSPGAAIRWESGFMPWLDLRVGAFGTHLDEASVGAAPGSFASDVIAGRADVCAVAALQRLRLLGCAGAAAGRFRTVGRGYSESETDNSQWWAVIAGLEAQIDLGQLVSLAVSVDLVVPTASWHVQVLGPDGRQVEAIELDPLGAMIGVGPIFRVF